MSELPPAAPPPAMPTPLAGPQANGPHQMPTVVHVATILMFALTIVSILGTALFLATSLDEVVEQARKSALDSNQDASASELDRVEASTRAGVIIGSVITILFAIAISALAWFVRKGSRGARIASWVVLGLYALFYMCSLTVGGEGSDAVALVSGVMALGLSAAAVVLLALPAAHPFFAKPGPVWQPPNLDGPASAGAS